MIKIFYNGESKQWMAYEAPKFIDDMYHVENCLNDRALKQAKANALPVLNPEIIINHYGAAQYGEDGIERDWAGTAEKTNYVGPLSPPLQYGYILSPPKQESKPADKRIEHCGGVNCPFEYSCVYGCMRPFERLSDQQLKSEPADRIEEETAEEIVKLILKELEKAKAKHPAWPIDVIHAAAIVQEESGELMRAALQWNYEEGDPKELKKEAIQTAAMCIRFLQNSYININQLADGN